MKCVSFRLFHFIPLSRLPPPLPPQPQPTSVAPPHELPLPAVQPKQCEEVRIRRPARASRLVGKLQKLEKTVFKINKIVSKCY